MYVCYVEVNKFKDAEKAKSEGNPVATADSDLSNNEENVKENLIDNDDD